MPRTSLAILSVLHAAAFAWVAVVLPWGSWTLLAVASAAIAALHLATGVLAALRHARLRVVWRAQSFASFVYLAYLATGLLSSAAYVHGLYAGLGSGVMAALLFLLMPAILFTAPIGAWGIASTGGLALRPRSAGVGGVGLALLFGAHLVRADRAPRPVATLAPGGGATELAARLTPIFASFRDAAADASPSPPLRVDAPVRCAQAVDGGGATLVVTYVARATHRATSVCLQAASADGVVSALEGLVQRDVLPGPLKIDAITAARAVLPLTSIAAPFALRPAFDGACVHDRCLMPWQLVARDVFNGNMPIKSVPDLRLGVSFDVVRRALGAGPDDPLLRVETASVVVAADGAVHPYPYDDRGSPEVAIPRAAKLAEGYIEAAQQPNGRFAYVVDPFSGKERDASLSVARQAGTTLAWCDHATSPRKREVAARSLALLASLERRLPGDKALLLDKPGSRPHLSGATLPLAAFVACRSVVGRGHDALIDRLARFILGQQRADGGFYHEVDAQTGSPAPGRGALYADGQAVLGLTLLEAVAQREGRGFPDAATLHDAVERAMAHFAGAYWSTFAGQFFFMEENWHCIAAAASLHHHRHRGYERFCLDYLAFKARLVFDAGSGVRAEFVGGYGVANVVPPHATPTAGFGEALAAGIAIKRARSEDVAADLQTMRDVLSFLARSQWTPESCFACTRARRIPGGFSEHAASPLLRIDYAQHAWSALTNGGEALGLSI